MCLIFTKGLSITVKDLSATPVVLNEKAVIRNVQRVDNLKRSNCGLKFNLDILNYFLT